MSEIVVRVSQPRLQDEVVDTRAHRALVTLRPNFYLNGRLTGDARERAIDFLEREYIDKGRALFGRGPSPEMLNDLRKAVGGTIANFSDEEVLRIICFATQRVRTFGNVMQLRQGRYKWAKIVSHRGPARPICNALNETFFRVRVAAEVLEEIAALPVADQGYFIRQIIEIGQTEDFVQSLRLSIDNRIVPESFTEKGFCIPPLHELCGCRIEGVDKEEVEGRVSANSLF